MTPADRLYAQAADLFGTDPDETDDLTRDWQAARRSHRRPTLWERIRRPLRPRCRSVCADGVRCQVRTVDGGHPGQHGHYDPGSGHVYAWPNLTPGVCRVSTPAWRNPKTGTTTIRVKRCCNQCGTELGDATTVETAYATHGLPLPDVSGECPTCLAAEGSAA
jgi:hypothetical protein